jgi:hypothetical protein
MNYGGLHSTLRSGVRILGAKRPLKVRRVIERAVKTDPVNVYPTMEGVALSWNFLGRVLLLRNVVGPVKDERGIHELKLAARLLMNDVIVAATAETRVRFRVMARRRANRSRIA